MSKTTREAWDRMWLEIRRACACVLMGWVLRLVPKTDKNTLLGIHSVLSGIMKDDEARDVAASVE